MEGRVSSIYPRRRKNLTSNEENKGNSPMQEKGGMSKRIRSNKNKRSGLKTMGTSNNSKRGMLGEKGTTIKIWTTAYETD